MSGGDASCIKEQETAAVKRPTTGAAERGKAAPEAKQKSDLSRAFSEDGAVKTHVGGQALIEGVMMRGTYNWAVAVREPSGGVYLEEHDLASGRTKNGWMSWPLVRGCRALVESLMLGYKALEIAALHAFADEEDSAGESVEGVGDARPVSRDAASPSATPHFAARNSSDFSCASFFLSGEGKDGVKRVVAGDDVSPDARSVDLSHEGSFAACDSSLDAAADSFAGDKGFSWKDDFGRPGTVIDALGAQTTLEVVEEPLAGGFIDASETPEKKSFLDQEAEFGKKEMAISMVIGLVLGVVLFIGAPALLTNLIVGEYDSNTLLWNIVDGFLRVLVFVFYLWLIGRMGEIKRMFGYHGAEHKTIHCYEHGLPLTPENARSFPRLHVRCGTAFLIMVMVIAILVYTITPVNALIAAWGVPDGAPKLALVIFCHVLYSCLLLLELPTR